MKTKVILVILISIILTACWVNSKENQPKPDINDKYFEYLKVNSNLTFSGAKEITVNDLKGKEYYHFTYKNGVLIKIKSHSSVSNSFHELNKYIFNVNKEWKEININTSAKAIEYSFTNNIELIKFIISYNEQKIPIKFQVLPFNLTYDNFNILGKSVVCSGKFAYNDDNLLDKILWLDSNTEYRYIYDKKGNLNIKNIYNNGSILFEFRYELNKFGIVESVK